MDNIRNRRMGVKKGRILVVDDDEDVLLAARLLLKTVAAEVVTEKNPEHLTSLLRREKFDVIMLDMNYKSMVNTGNEGFYWLRKIMELSGQSVVIMITAYGDVEMAVRALKEGATDFVLKPWQNEKLLATVNAALKLSFSGRELNDLRQQKDTLSADIDRNFIDIIGKSQLLKKVFSVIEKVAATDANVLVLGENGTGKELVARALHRHSARSSQAFITVDMGAISESLFESELFGHVKGSFTDAREDRPGRFEIASGGTLFLDEIGNLSLQMQAKLLTVLQNREVSRVGSNKPVPIDIRLICATNCDINAMVARKTFRQDLLYRINTVEIPLPPLRDRPEDIPLLVSHFIDIYCRKYRKNIKTVSHAARKALERYPWYGNVRELQHSVERAVILSETDVLEFSDFFLQDSVSGDQENLRQGNLRDAEKMHIQRVIRKHSGNISHAARELGLTRASLYRRIEKYGF
jgi:two-component system response regulator HydG